ncbi:MAG: ferrous iron transport protein B [Alphaproteobacteria bacterium]|nr:MAG: ferrous iron transport protein B [Alphaproteobacteria bacterium]
MMSVSEVAYRLALVGSPNSGKTSLFNALTGARQKVANYPGVTVERRSGRIKTGDVVVDVIDLPGSYSLRGRSPDEEITRDFVLGQFAGEAPPDVILCVVDATNLRHHLRLALELKAYGRPMLLALNMMDLAQRRGMEIDVEKLSQELAMPVVPTVAVRKAGIEALVQRLSLDIKSLAESDQPSDEPWQPPSIAEFRHLHGEARRIAQAVIVKEGMASTVSRQLDDVLLHPLLGPVILLAVLFLMFQAVFTLAEMPMNLIDSGVVWLQEVLGRSLPAGPLRSLLLHGILAGVGSVLIFLPQISILFLLILLLEGSGYMARAAFLMDKLMAAVGLNGRAFIPLLSSFACAVPGIMATRTIDNPRDRLTTILVAPLMTCSARLPVYTLLIAAFVPNTTIFFGAGMQGLVMFALYLTGVVFALLVAAVLKRTVTRGSSQPLLMELPSYKVPQVSQVLLGVWTRVKIFLKRAGTIILGIMIILWALASYPAPPPGATESAVTYSLAGMMGRALAPLFAPIGFNWEIMIALIPGLAAREVAVAALGTVYALSGSEDAVVESLSQVLRASWSLPTALALLAWYVFAPQCVATLVATRRETNSWQWPAFMFTYLIVLAYAAAWITYRVTLALT